MSRVVLTQPAPRCIGLAERLQARGHDVLRVTVQRLARTPDAPAPGDLVAGLAGRVDWVVFVSPGVIELSFEGDPAAASGWPAEVGIAVVGPGSAEALAATTLPVSGLRVVWPDRPPYDAQALLRQPPFDAPAGLRILVLHGEQGRIDWLDELRRRGASVDRIALYRNDSVIPDVEVVPELAGWAGGPGPVVFSFTSAASARAVDAWLESVGLAAWARRQPALTVHPRIEAALHSLGWAVVRLIEPGEHALAAGIESA